MYDHPSANTSGALCKTLLIGETENNWLVEWLALNDVLSSFHVSRLHSVLEDALANCSRVSELSRTSAHAALSDFFETKTALVARPRQPLRTEVSVAFTAETNTTAAPESCCEMLVFVWHDPFELVVRDITSDRRVRCFRSQASGRLMSRSVRVLDLPAAAPLATPPILRDTANPAATPFTRTGEGLDALMQSMRWPDDAVTEAQLSALPITRRSKRLPGISALLKLLEDDDLTHGPPTMSPVNGSPPYKGDTQEIEEFDLCEYMITADGKHASRPRHIISASDRFRQSVEKVEYGLERYVARLLRDRFPREVRRAATVRGQFHVNAAQWMVCGRNSATCAFRANAMVAERGWLTGVARQSVSGENLPTWILPVVDVVDMRGPVRAALRHALVIEMQRLRTPLMRSVPNLGPALLRYLASSACSALPVDLITALCLTLSPHAADWWPMDQSRVHELAEAEHIRIQWQTALLLHAARSSAPEATLRRLRRKLIAAGTDETRKQLRGLTALTMSDWVEQIRNPVASAWQSHSSMAEGSEMPWQALFVGWLEAVDTLVPKDAPQSVRDTGTMALSASTTRALRRAMTALSARTNLSGFRVADLSNDSMPDHLYRLLNALTQRFRSIDGCYWPEIENGFMFPRFVERSTFEIVFEGVVYRAEVLTELRRIRKVGELMENCLRGSHSVFHMLTRGDVQIAWSEVSAPNVPIGLVELELIGDADGLPSAATSSSPAQWPLRWSVSEALGPKNCPQSDEQLSVAAAIAQRFEHLANTAVNSISAISTQAPASAKACSWRVLFESIARTVKASDLLDRMLLGTTDQGVISCTDVDAADDELGDSVSRTTDIDAELLAALQRFRLCRSFEIANSRNRGVP